MTGKINAIANLITIRQGDSYELELQFRKGNCAQAIDMTDCIVKAQARNDSNEVVFEKTADSINIEQGLYCLRFTPSETNISVGDYRMDIQYMMPDGSVHTFFPSDPDKLGTLRITEQVTE